VKLVEALGIPSNVLEFSEFTVRTSKPKLSLDIKSPYCSFGIFLQHKGKTMTKAASYDQIYTISMVRVANDEGNVDATGVADGVLIIAENSKTGKSVGLYGIDLDTSEVFVGSSRHDVVAAFVESKIAGELEEIFGNGKEAGFYCELIGGGIDGDLSDFEYENEISTLIGDEDNELDLGQSIDRVGISVCIVLGAKASIDTGSKSIRYNKEAIADLGEWYNELQFDGAIRLVLLNA
jgi:hypothetical protein